MIVWLVAFVLHSTFWMGLAWFATRMTPRMQARTREVVWYTAIAASLIASTVQAFAPDGFASLWHLTLPGIVFSSSDPAHVAGASVAALDGASAAMGWETSLFGVWLSVCAILVLRYMGQLAVLRERLGREVIGGDSREAAMLREISLRAGLSRPPLLSESENLGSPIAIGFGARSEVCIPIRAINELDEDQFRAMLAHEVAHHARRDPVRLAALNLLRLVFFFQPLFRLAGRDVHRAAEEQCDAWAAGLVDDRLAMASCLTEVARWVLPGNRGLPVVGLVRGNSQLLRRVARLMDEGGAPVGRGGSGRVLGAVFVLVLSPWLAPGLATSDGLGADVPPLSVNGVEAAARSVAAPDTDLRSEHEGREGGQGNESKAGTDERSELERRAAREGSGEHDDGREDDREHGVDGRGGEGGDGDGRR